MTTELARNGMPAADLGDDGWAKPWSDNGGDCLRPRSCPAAASRCASPPTLTPPR